MLTKAYVNDAETPLRKRTLTMDTCTSTPQKGANVSFINDLKDQWMKDGIPPQDF
jgi:hypothetical protein